MNAFFVCLYCTERLFSLFLIFLHSFILVALFKGSVNDDELFRSDFFNDPFTAS